jgi:hypothetical protein
MNPLREVLSFHARISSVHRLWLLAAAIAAVLLLSFYVNLLLGQVARGEQLRQATRGTANQAVTRVAVLPTSLAVIQQREVSAADGQVRRSMVSFQSP